jgi:hypothetical protein
MVQRDAIDEGWWLDEQRVNTAPRCWVMVLCGRPIWKRHAAICGLQVHGL